LQPCADIYGEIIPLGTGLEVNVAKKVLNPFNNYLFKVNASQNAKTNFAEVIIMVIDFRIPVLIIDIDQNLL